MQNDIKMIDDGLKVRTVRAGRSGKEAVISFLL